jgi:hypothetical protein
MSRSTTLALALFAALGAAGCNLDVYECSDSSKCTRAGVQGTCMPAPNGASYCAFPDTNCGEGSRWDKTAGGGFSGVCLGEAPQNGEDMTVTDQSGDDMAMPGDLAMNADAPRLIAPLSATNVTSRKPKLRWTITNAPDSVVVDLCKDRACTQSVGSATVDAGMTSALVDADLPIGAVYWRVRAKRGASETPSPVWQMFVPSRSAPVNISTGAIADVNGDGLADVLATSNTMVRVFFGKSSGAAVQPPAAGQDQLIDLTAVAAGLSVAAAGDVNGDGYADVIVGSQATKIGNNNNAGRIYVYYGSDAGLDLAHAQSIDGSDGIARFGYSVASAGDLNGDGYADVIVGAPAAGGNSGRIHVYYGGADGLQPTASMRSASVDNPDGATAYYGASVASAGDINGDGYGDVIVGAPLATINAASQTGRVHIYLGGSDGLQPTTAGRFQTIDGPDGASAWFGNANAAGDFNGDGYSDIIVGAPYPSGAGVSQVGHVHVYLGSASGTVTSHVTVAGVPTGGALTNHEFAATVAAGDFNGDGFDDAVVGDTGTANVSGVVWIYTGSSTGLAPSTSGRFVQLTTTDGFDDGSSNSFGVGIARIGDINADGFGDLVIGASGYTPSGGSLLGRIHIYKGSPNATGIVNGTDITIDGGVAFDYFGQWVAMWSAPPAAREYAIFKA